MHPPLLPIPSDVQWQEGYFILPAKFNACASDLEPLVTDWVRDCGDVLDAVTPAYGNDTSAHLVLTCASPDEGLPALGDDETYRLEIGASGIHLTAPTRTGIFYGLQTLLQLGHRADGGIGFPHCVIKDAPRFAWRGLMLDVARHFMPLDLVKRMIDGMARAKLNVLHFGLSNNQGFRVESKRFPRLHTVASNGEFFSQNEIRELVRFAAARGVRIVPEFNMPGHSTAFTFAYTELAAGAPPEGLRKTSGVFDDEMNPASPHVTRFVRDFIGEMAPLFPDTHWHFGGDEVTGKSWDGDPSVQSFMKAHSLADNRALQAHFTRQVLDVLKDNGKQGVGWEEVVHGGPPRDTIIQPWMNPASDDAFEGYPLIISTSYYLDHFLRADDYIQIDPQPDDTSGDIVGAEACVWSEVMNADNVEAIIWPGALSLAERFWSPNDTDLLWQRISATQDRMEKLGCADLEAPERLAARLCGGKILPSVALLRDYTAPLVYYFVMNRAAAPHDITAPFSRLIETLLPETEATHRFEAHALAALAGDTKALISELNRLERLGDNFRTETANLAALQENQPVADMLSALATAALAVLKSGKTSGDLPLDVLMPPASNDLTGVLEAVARRRKADLPLLLQEMNIPVLPALRRVLDHFRTDEKPS